MRLGAQECLVDKNSLAYKMYKKSFISERHRHRYEVNANLLNCFLETDFIFSDNFFSSHSI